MLVEEEREREEQERREQEEREKEQREERERLKVHLVHSAPITHTHM